MGRYTQAFELSTNLAMFYTRCYMLAHLTRNDKHKDCALAYNNRIYVIPNLIPMQPFKTTLKKIWI